MRLLVTGRDGQVGWELMRALQPLGEVVGRSRAELDLGDTDAIVRTLRELRPDAVVNPAAYTAVDKAETETAAAHAINAVAPGVLAEECRRLGSLLVHYSTDYVFDGSGSAAWRESDPTAPVNEYGRTKLAGEQAIAQTGARHLILRTSWVYSLRGSNFLRTVVRLAQTRDALRIVGDQFGAPTPAGWLADLSAQMISRHFGCERFRSLSGVYHATCGGATSWHGYASAIVEMLGAMQPAREEFRLARVPTIESIPSSAYPTPARRPANSRLDMQRLEQDWELAVPDWRDALRFVLRDA